MSDRRSLIFALKSTAALGQTVASALEWPLAAHEEREFEDGEHKARPLDSVRGAEVFVLQNLHGDAAQTANDKLIRLLFFVGTLKDAGATRVTAVTPYLCYARKDRRTKPNDPVNSRYVASLFEAVGTDAVIMLDVHNPAAGENAFRIPTIALTAAPLFVEYAKGLKADHLCVVSPDPGGVKRADIFHEALEAALGRPVGKGFVEKRRSAGVVSGELFVGAAQGATALIIDDLVSTGGTLIRAAHAARKAGAQRVIALVTHGLFQPGAEAIFSDPAIDRIVTTDSAGRYDPGSAAARGKFDLLPAGPLIAECIRRIEAGTSLNDLLVF